MREDKTSGTSFSVRLSKDEWNPELGGWHCSALRIPGAIVEEIYYEGAPLSKNQYRISVTNEIIHWLSNDPRPDVIAVIFNLTTKLSTEAETVKWKKLAIILPVLATILSPLLVAGFNYVTRPRVTPANQNENVTLENQNSAKVSPNPSDSCPGPWAIVLETINPRDGGREAALQELTNKANLRGYNNSYLIAYGGTYKVVIYFPTAQDANNHLGVAKEINPSVSGVINLNNICGTCIKAESTIYNCSNDFRSK